MKKLRFDIIFLILSFVILAAALLPIFYVGIYDRITTWDDIAYSLEIHQLLASGVTFSSLFATLWDKLTTCYNNWQGTYSSIVMFTLEPGIWGNKVYAATPFILTSVLYASLFFFSRTILKSFKMQEKINIFTLIFTNLIFLFSISFLPSINNAIYWYNGAIHYVFFYSLQLCYIAVNIRIMSKEPKNTIWIWAPLIMIFSFILAGANLVTMLLQGILTFSIMFFGVIARKNHKVILTTMLAFFVACIGIYINVKAPGNTLRQHYETPMSTIPAFWASIKQIWFYIADYTSWPLIISGVFIAFIFWSQTKKTDFKFKYPLILLVFSLALIGAQSMPGFYATSFEGPVRLQNIVVCSYILLFYINIAYITGWLAKKIEIHKIKKIKIPGFANGIICIILIISFIASLFFVYKDTNIYLVARDMKVAKEYGAEWDNIWSILDSSYNGNVRIPYPQYLPYTLTQIYDFDGDHQSNFNIGFAKFTDKMSFGFTGPDRVVRARYKDKIYVGNETFNVNFMRLMSDIDERTNYVAISTLASVLKDTNAKFNVTMDGDTIQITTGVPISSVYYDIIQYTGTTWPPDDKTTTIYIDGKEVQVPYFFWGDHCYVALGAMCNLLGVSAKADQNDGIILTVNQ